MIDEVVFLAVFALGITIIGLFMSRGKDLLEPAVGITGLYVLFFVVRPMIIMMGGPNPLSLTDEAVMRMALIGVLGEVSFYLGYHGQLPYLIALRLPKPGKTSSIRLFLLLLFYLCLSWLGVLAIARSAGWDIIRKSPIEVAFMMKEGGGYLNTLLRAGFVVLLTCWALFCFERRNRVAWALFPIAVITYVLIATIGGLRGLVAQAVIAMAILSLYRRRTNFPYRLAFTLGGVLSAGVALTLGIMILVLLNLYRHYGTIDWRLALSPAVWWNQLQAALIPFDWAVYFAQRVEPLWFVHYFYSLIGFIPRQLWPDKPVISVAYALTDAYVGDPLVVPTLTTTIPGELHLQIPIAGVVVGMFLLGLFLAIVYEYRRLNASLWVSNMLYALFYAGTLRAFYTTFQTWLFELVLTYGILLAPIFALGLTWRRTSLKAVKKNNQINL